MLPYLNNVQKTRDYQTQFLGINHTENCGEGEFFDATNLSSDLYPILSTREADVRVQTSGTGNIKAMIFKDELCYVQGESLFIGDKLVEDFPIAAEFDENGEELPIQLVSMGAYLLIFPQNLYINTKDPEEKGSMKERYDQEDAKYTVYCSLVDREGNLIFPNLNSYPLSQEEAESAGVGFYVQPGADGEEMKLFKKYTEGEAVGWATTSDCYVAITTGPAVMNGGEAFGSRFPEGSVILLSGFGEALDGQKTVYKHIYSGDGNFGRIGDAIFVPGVISETTAPWDSFYIERLIPKMDYVIEHNNRLWACRYGKDLNGNRVNEIFSSALGDFKQWYNSGTGSEAGAFYQPLGSDGAFTGAIVYGGTPIFFKERYYHRVNGYYPSDFRTQTSQMPGVQNGAYKSLAIVNSLLFYKGVGGIYVYDGTTPEMISQKLGKEERIALAAGGHREKYYVCLRSENGCDTYVFDTNRGIWQKYRFPSSHFASDGESLYYAFRDILIKLTNEDSSEMQWYAETGIIGRETIDKKYITKLNIRAEIKMFSRVMFFIEYDSSGAWIPIGVLEGRALRSFSLPIRLNRCDHFRLRIEGTGTAKILSMSKTVVEGSDR